MLKRSSLLVGLATMLLLSGCSTTYKIEPDLVKNFKPEATPSKDETFVYVIRGSNFQGGARGLWVAANENVVADLSNGSHTLLKLKTGLNSIHMVQGLAGFGFAAVDNKPGETVYLAIDYTTGKLKDVGFELGASMVMQTNRAKDIGAPRHNDAYDNLLVNPSLLNFPVMKKTEQLMKPDDKSAVINFYRMETLIKDVPFDIWSQEGYIGSTKGDQYFQVRVAPGKHTFVALSERYSVIDAEVEAGKEYNVEFDVDMGWNQAHVQMLPLEPKKSKKSIAKWQKKAELVAVDKTVIESEEFSERVEMAREYLKKIFLKISAGELSTRVLDNKNAI